MSASVERDAGYYFSKKPCEGCTHLTGLLIAGLVAEGWPIPGEENVEESHVGACQRVGEPCWLWMEKGNDFDVVEVAEQALDQCWKVGNPSK